MLRCTLRTLQSRSRGAGAHFGVLGAATAINMHPTSPSSTDFVYRASQMKRRFRGKGLYRFAREEAQRFLEAEVPKTNVNEWVEQPHHAVALAQLLNFFDIEPESPMASLLLNKLVRTAEDVRQLPEERLKATVLLTMLRPEENYERAFTTTEDVLRTSVLASLPPQRKWACLDLCAKVLQRCGKRVPTAVSERLAEQVMALIAATPLTDIPRFQASLLRIYSWMVRAERPEATRLLTLLVEHSGEAKSFDFATLLLSCARHHQVQPLPMPLILHLSRTSLQYCSRSNGKTVATILRVVGRFLSSCDGATPTELSELANRFNALLDDFLPRVRRFLDAQDVLYWPSAEDVTTIAFAYELGGRLRFRSLFIAYSEYVQREGATMEPPQLALATGILRRSCLLNPHLVDALSARIEFCLGDLTLSELGHICATFATLPQQPAWAEEAKMVAHRLLASTDVENIAPMAVANLALAFPEDRRFSADLDFQKLSGMQLVDLLPLVRAQPQRQREVIAALVGRLQAPSMERFSPDDVRVLMHCEYHELVVAAQEHLQRLLTAETWNMDLLYCLPLLPPHSIAQMPIEKALTAAHAASISPEQFISLAELLTSVFGDQHAGIGAFVVSGGDDLLRAQDVNGVCIARYLAVVRSFAAVRPSAEWLARFAARDGNFLDDLKSEELESFLISLRTIFTDVSRSPALQPLLTDVVQRNYQRLREADPHSARLTVMLVHLQRGMQLPLITEASPMIPKLRAAMATLPEEVAEALRKMPIPPAQHMKNNNNNNIRVGRFTLVRRSSDAEREDHPLPLLDLNDEDPFALPTGDEKPAAPEAKVEAVAPTPTPTPTDAADPCAAVPPTPTPDLEAPLKVVVMDATEDMRTVERPPLSDFAAAFGATPNLDENPPVAEVEAEQQQQQQQQQYHHHQEAMEQKMEVPQRVEEVHEPSQPRVSSYFSKFSSSVGKLMAGSGSAHDVEAEPPQPRRTNLSHHNSHAARGEEIPAAAAADVPASAPASISGGWPVEEEPTPMWQPYGMPTAAQNESLFSKLFDAPPTEGAHVPAHVQPPSPPSPTTTPTLSSTMIHAHGIYSDAPPEYVATPKIGVAATPPAARTPSSIPHSASPPSAFAAVARDQRPLVSGSNIFMNPENKAVSAPRVGGVQPLRPIISKTFSGRAMGSGVVASNSNNNFGRVQEQVPTRHATQTPTSTEVAARRGLFAPAVESTPPSTLAWHHTSQRLARVSRLPKTNKKSRAQQSLSDWLNAPAHTKQSRSRKGHSQAHAAAAPAASSKSNGRGRRGDAQTSANASSEARKGRKKISGGMAAATKKGAAAAAAARAAQRKATPAAKKSEKKHTHAHKPSPVKRSSVPAPKKAKAAKKAAPKRPKVVVKIAIKNKKKK